MNSQTLKLPTMEISKYESQQADFVWKCFLLGITLLTITGYLIFSKYLHIPPKYLYKPGDNVGYCLGLTGGLLMLIMLLYSLRKRFSFMNKYGGLPFWFRWHMILGVLGTALVILHSTYVIHSINAGVAMACMMLVSCSGVFGRFVYTKIHNGLYGRETTLKQLNENLAKSGGFREAFARFAPQIDNRLDMFRNSVEDLTVGFFSTISIELQTVYLSKSLMKELHQVMYTQASEEYWGIGKTKHDLDNIYENYAMQIHAYIMALRDFAQFRAYERLFSLWHYFHIPLVYMLVISGIYHVIAVHMY